MCQYDFKLNLFSAPVHGIYNFGLNFIADSSIMANTNLAIMVNDVLQCGAHADGAHRHSTGTCYALVYLSTGDLVNVKLDDPQGDGGVAFGAFYSILTGFLFQAL